MRRTSPEQLKKISAWRADRQREPGFFLSGDFPNIANQRMHWAVKARLAKTHRGNGKSIGATIRFTLKQAPGYVVTFTRYSSKRCDSGDGLPQCFKNLRDGIADAFGLDDSEQSILSWEYRQETSPRGCRGVRIVIEAKE